MCVCVCARLRENGTSYSVCQLSVWWSVCEKARERYMIPSERRVNLPNAALAHHSFDVCVSHRCAEAWLRASQRAA